MASRRVFVVGPYVPNGGTFMAYHVARIVQENFGLAVTAVTVADETPAHGIFRYDPVFPPVTIEEMERTITPDDVLLANAGHSRFVFGPRIPGRKLMYVQGFTTPRPLDCSFDGYVAVSGFVQRFLKNVYDVKAPVIPPFVDVDGVPPPPEWNDRPPDSLVVHVKDSVAALAGLAGAVARRDLAADLSAHRPQTPQPQFKAALGSARYLISVSSAEGFGLVPLEAMAMGTTVVAFDGFGGREYMVDGGNCACTRYSDFEGLADRVVRALRDPNHARRLAAAGRRTAARYDYGTFRARWIAELARFLKH